MEKLRTMIGIWWRDKILMREIVECIVEGQWYLMMGKG